MTITIGLTALFLTIPRTVAASRLEAKVLSPLAAMAVLLASSAHVNLVFAAYPTLGTVFGVEAAERITLDQLPSRQQSAFLSPPGGPLETAWKPPTSMPEAGKLVSAAVPATVSGFGARPAEIYLPPSYFTEPRPLLPVMILMAGQPGTPKDWLNGGKLAETMTAFAHEHAGLAPIVIIADSTGSSLANPLCVDSSRGNVDTYLSQDVPNWVKSTLQGNPDPHAWIVAGLSSGGTCSIQLATNHPEVYPTFLDLSGQLEPTLGDRSRALLEVFGGSEAAFTAVNPLDLLKTRRYPGSGGAFVVGAEDHTYKNGQLVLYQAAKAAGMDVQYAEVSGGHSFAVWSEGLKAQLPWLMKRVGLIS